MEARRLLELRLGRVVSEPDHFRSTSLSHMSWLVGFDQRYVVKALPSFFAHEGRIVEILHSIEPDLVPIPVLLATDWWVASEFAATDAPDLGLMFLALGRLQRASTAVLQDLRSAGARLATGGVMEKRILASLDEAHPETAALIAARSAVLHALLRAYDNSDIAPTLIHGDLNPANVAANAASLTLYDWTDCSIAHPFVDLTRFADTPSFSEAARAYASEWSLPAHALESELSLSLGWGAAFQLWNYLELIDQVRAAGDDLMDLIEHRDHWFGRLGWELERLADTV